MRNIVFGVVLVCLPLIAGAQEKDMELMRTRLELLDAKIRLLERDLEYLESRPQEFQRQMDWMESYFRTQRDSIMYLMRKAGYMSWFNDSMGREPFRSNLYIDPYRLFEGSIMLGYERALSPGLSLELAFLGTYLTKGGGLGGGYFDSQELGAYNEFTGTYETIDGDMITGWGLVLKAKKYLLSRLNPQSHAPIGLYAAPQLMYRNLTISGMTYPLMVDHYEEIEVTQHLNVFAGGVVLGGKFALMKVFSVDVFIGGMMRLSQYRGDSRFTRYKQWNNIDYSGVLPTAGISLGILQ